MLKVYKGINEKHRLDHWGKQGYINSKIQDLISVGQFMKTNSRSIININA